MRSRDWLHTGGALFLLFALATPLLAGQMERKEAATDKTTVLDGVDRYRVPEPLFEGVRVILGYRGEEYSPAYVQGISGAAFRIGGPCPCAPTCEFAMSTVDLVRLLGYEAEPVGFGEDPTAQLPAVLTRLKEEVRASRPVLAWNAFTVAEFDVVCGFDEGTSELIGRGSYKGLKDYVRGPEGRLASTEVAPAIGLVLIGKKVREFDARAAEVAALKEAVAHAHGASRTLDCLPAGLASYDYWVGAYRNRAKLARARSRDEKQDLGFVSAQPPDDFYPLTILPSTRQAAAEFLREIAPKYPEAKAHLEMAAEHFAGEAKALEACVQALGDRKQTPSDEQCIRAAGCLSQARAMYALGVEEMAAALGKIGK